MKALLMHPDRDFDSKQELPRHAPDVTQDLELETLLRAMAGEDEFLLNVGRNALFSGLQNDVETIVYRQHVLNDCLRHPALIRELYSLIVSALEERKKYYFAVFTLSVSSILYDAVEILEMLTGMLKKLKSVADSHADRFESKGFTALFTMLRTELSDEYIAMVQSHLTELKFRHGVLVSAQLGPVNEGVDYVLRRPRGKEPNWLMRSFGKGPPGYTIRVSDRDDAGAEILSEMRNQGIAVVANALAQSTVHILDFFEMLRTELAFYVGCLNLYDRLVPRGLPLAFPQPQPAGARIHAFRDLHDVCLALTMDQKVVGNDLDADGKSVAIITGANQGGKSSFLRSIGVAQLMMQCGMFVAAKSFTAEVCTGLFTHYKREEDVALKSGKLKEELDRMSDIVETITSNSLLLLNESFASTNEREGSEIAAQIVRALLERGIKVVFVTHLYEFAHCMLGRKGIDAIFLLAERRADGTRTFKIVAGEPLKTSYAEDLYRKIFAVEARPI